MVSGNRASRFSFGRANILALSIVMGFALTGCASKSSKDQLSWDGTTGGRGGKTLEQIIAAQESEDASRWSHAPVQADELDQFAHGGAAGKFGKGKSRRPGAGLGSSDDPVGALAGNEWEHALIPGLDVDDFTPEQLADRVAAAREHALNVAREDEDPSLYAAVTGGRDLYQDLATEYAFSPDRLRELQADYASNPNRNFERRGFFDEESYAFDESMTPAERMAARVEAARRRAGQDDGFEDTMTASADGIYSRIYQRDDDASLTGSLLAQGRSGSSAADATAGRGGTVGSRRDRKGGVDVAMADADVKEDIVPQTLNGALPMIIGVDEQGQFQFDDYRLQDEVKARLDELAVKLQDAEFDQLDVLGFTDRIGDPAYNKSLSRKRALAVAQYLRDKGVPEDKIRVRGLGQERPVTKFEDCEGLRGDDKISCLQPDRRVEIAAYIRRMNVDIQ